MIEYKYHLATAIYTGHDVVVKKAQAMRRLGKRAFIITTEFPEGIKHLALEDVIKACEGLDIEYRVSCEAIPNPTIASINEISKKIIDYNPDFLIACGGGSAIDTAKACAVLFGYPGEDPFKVIYETPAPVEWSIGLGDATLHLVAIPTTAGTGSEVSQTAVLTNERKKTKVVMNQRMWPVIAYLDSKYVKSAPDILLHASAMDALTHGVETYLNNDSIFLSNAYAMEGFKLFKKYKDHLFNKCMTDDDYDNLTLASNVFGMGMMYRTTITHGMGYPLTEEKKLPHGLACAVFLGEFLRNFKDRTLIEPIISTCGFNDVDEFADYVNGLLQPYIEFTCTEEEIIRWTDQMFAIKWRIDKNPEPLVWEDIKRIYDKSLAKCIVK